MVENDKCNEEKEHAILDWELKAWPRSDMQGLNEIDVVTETSKRQVAYILVWIKSNVVWKKTNLNKNLVDTMIRRFWRRLQPDLQKGLDTSTQNYKFENARVLIKIDQDTTHREVVTIHIRIKNSQEDCVGTDKQEGQESI